MVTLHQIIKQWYKPAPCRTTHEPVMQGTPCPDVTDSLNRYSNTQDMRSSDTGNSQTQETPRHSETQSIQATHTQYSVLHGANRSTLAIPQGSVSTCAVTRAINGVLKRRQPGQALSTGHPNLCSKGYDELCHSEVACAASLLACGPPLPSDVPYGANSTFDNNEDQQACSKAAPIQNAERLASCDKIVVVLGTKCEVE